MARNPKEDLIYKFENANWKVTVEWLTWPADPTDHICCEIFNKKTHDREVVWQHVGHGDTKLHWDRHPIAPKYIQSKANRLAKELYKQLLAMGLEQQQAS